MPTVNVLQWAYDYDTDKLGPAYSILAGKHVHRASEEWRHECLCLHVLDVLPDRDARNEFLYGRKELQQNGTTKVVSKGIAGFHSQAEADRIRDDCMRIHKYRQAKQNEN